MCAELARLRLSSPRDVLRAEIGTALVICVGSTEGARKTYIDGGVDCKFGSGENLFALLIALLDMV